jgi:hypothetical protein
MSFKCTVCGSKRADQYVYCSDCGGASCGQCGKPHELVRPGKTQPMCDCDAGTLVSLRDQLEPKRDFPGGRALKHLVTKRIRVKASERPDADIYFIGDEEP